jgi:hypothetical protein
MTLSVKHAFQSALSDSGDASLVQPSNWNAEHDMTTDTGTLLGDVDGKGTVGAITVGSGLSLAGGELTASASGASLPLQLPIRDAAYYLPYGVATEATSSGWAADGFLELVPFVTAHAEEWTRIGITVEISAVGGLARLGIYNASTNALVVDAGEVDCSSTGDKELTISFTSVPGAIYWLAKHDNDAGHSFANVSFRDCADFWGLNSPSDIGSRPQAIGYPASNPSYGALPATLDAPIAPDGGQAPMIWLRTGV